MQCYINPSEEKQVAYQCCLHSFSNDKGRYGTVLSKNQYRFSVAYIVPDSKQFIVHTAHTKYIFDLTDAQFEQYKNAAAQYNKTVFHVI